MDPSSKNGTAEVAQNLEAKMAWMSKFNVSYERKLFVLEQVNPVVKEMMRQVVQELPDDPIAHLLTWAKQKRAESGAP